MKLEHEHLGTLNETFCAINRIYFSHNYRTENPLLNCVLYHLCSLL
jgi:hypothetical protein